MYRLVSTHVAFLLFLSGLATARGQNDERSAPFQRATPESVGLSPDKVRTVLDGVGELVADQEAVGAQVLLIKDGKIILNEGVGWRDRESRLKMEPNTICCVRSMTKPVVGTAVQMLIDEGKLALTDRASKYLPSFDNAKSREITVEQLLTHTGGFPLTLISKELSAYSGQRSVADQAGETGPSGKAGVFAYSDCDSETLAAIVAQISGQPAEEFIRKRILEPLGMKDTYCVLDTDAPPRSQVSSNYAGTSAFWHKYWDRNDPPFFPFFLGAAALYSTPSDYARFLALWMDRGKVGSKRLLSEAAVTRALTPAMPMLALASPKPYPTGLPGFRLFYGQHWMVYQGEKADTPNTLPVFGHGGSDGTLALAFPEQKLMAFYFTQARGGLSVFQFEELIAPLVGLPAPPAPQRLSAKKLKPYIGQYRDTASGAIGYVYVHAGRLALELSGKGSVLVPHWPIEDDRWGFGQAAPEVAIRFDRGAGGDVVKLRIQEGKVESVLERVGPAKDLPTVAQLMADCRRQQGGDGIDALRVVQLFGTFSAGTAKLDLTFVADDHQVVQRLKIGTGEQVLLVKRDRGWRQLPGKAAENLNGMFHEQYARVNPLVRLGDWRKTATAVEVVRKDTAKEEEVWVVRLHGELLPPLTRYVSCKSGLLLKEEAWVVAKGVGMTKLNVRYEDYRAVAGVLLPFRVVSESAFTGKQVVQYENAKANPELPKGTFELLGAGK